MSDHVYRVTEVVGSSSVGYDDAIRKAVSRAAATIHNCEWFEVVHTRGHVVDGSVAHIQVTVKVGFRVDDDD